VKVDDVADDAAVVSDVDIDVVVIVVEAVGENNALFKKNI